METYVETYVETCSSQATTASIIPNFDAASFLAFDYTFRPARCELAMHMLSTINAISFVQLLFMCIQNLCLSSPPSSYATALKGP